MKIFNKKAHDKKSSTDLAAQFANLQGLDPWLWPNIPKWTLFGFVGLVSYCFVWFTWLSSTYTEISQVTEQEIALKESFVNKLTKASNLTALKEKKLQAVVLVNQLERQLPSKADIDALLSDINQAGIERGLRFERLRPSGVVLKDYYAELPIAMQVSGKFHDFAAFTAEIAALSRIVTLHGIQITSSKEGKDILKIDAVAKTYRYLDEEELQAQRKANRDKAGQK